MRRRICAGLLAALMLISGCGGSESSTLPETDASSDAVPEGGEPVEKTVVPLEDSYYQTNYIPDPSGWKGMSEEITGEPGMTSDAGIPSVFLTCGSEIQRDVYSECTVQIDASMTDEYAGTKQLAAKIRGRGHSTWEWPKKPYKIKLEEKQSLLGMTASKEWVLIANYADESLMRNITAFAIADAMGTFRFTPKAVPINLYMNGIYQGVYTLGEQIEVKSSRLELDYREDTPNTGYLIEIGGAEPDVNLKGKDCFDLPSGCAKDILIKSPKDEKLKQENYDFIYNYMCIADKAVTTLDNYETYIDVDSFIDWFLLHELTYNLDSCFHRSCFMYKDRGGKLKMGPVWDFDLAFGNMYLDPPDYDDWATVGSANSSSYIGVTWFNYLLTDESFRSKARARWDEIRDEVLDAANTAIDSTQEKLASSAALNFRVWDTLTIANGYQPQRMKDLSTYNEQVQYVRRFIRNRAEWIDNNL